MELLPQPPGIQREKDVRYLSRPRHTTYIWVAGGVAAVALTFVLAMSVTGSGLAGIKGLTPVRSEVVSPLAEGSGPSPYSPTQYIYLSQSFFSDGQTLSQNRNQTDEDKKVILEKLQKSLDTISEGITMYPKNASLWAQRATIEYALSSISPQALPASLTDMETAYRLTPDNPDYAKSLSDLYLKQCAAQHPEVCQLDKAVFYLTRSQQSKPNDSGLLYSLASLQVKAGMLKSAAVNYAKLLPLLTDLSLRERVVQEKQAVEALLAKAQKNASASQRVGASTQQQNTDATDAMTPSSPAGLELLPDQQTMSRELVVASPDQGPSPYEDTVSSSAFSGTATLPAGQTSITVEATRVTDTAPVYVTAQGKTNATLTVKSKKAGSYFVVTVDAPQPTDLPFQWWILNESK